MRLTRILALGGVVGPAFFIVAVLLSASLHAEYRHSVNFISELGATGTRYAAIMNYLGFVPAGLMLAAFGASLARISAGDPLAIVASLLSIVFGMGVAASGLISCDLGCPQSDGSMENAIHNRIAPISFISLICAIGIFGHRFRLTRYLRPLSTYSFATSVAGAFFLIALVSSLETRALTGLWQRLLLASLLLWCAITGLRIFRTSGRDAFQLRGPVERPSRP